MRFIKSLQYKSIFKTSLNLKSNYYAFATGCRKPKKVGKHCFALKPEIRLLPHKCAKNIHAYILGNSGRYCSDYKLQEKQNED